jgi:hypothetical protein
VETINSFFKKYEGLLNFLRWFFFPVVICGLFWILDGRYVQKKEWESLITAQKESTQQITAALTNLANEERDMAEAQRANTSFQSAIIARLDKRDALEDTLWMKNSDELKDDEKRISVLEIQQAKQDVEIHRNSEHIVEQEIRQK